MGFRQVFHGRWMLDLPGESAARLTKHAERTTAARILLLLAILYVSLHAPRGFRMGLSNPAHTELSPTKVCRPKAIFISYFCIHTRNNLKDLWTEDVDRSISAVASYLGFETFWVL